MIGLHGHSRDMQDPIQKAISLFGIEGKGCSNNTLRINFVIFWGEFAWPRIGRSDINTSNFKSMDASAIEAVVDFAS